MYCIIIYLPFVNVRSMCVSKETTYVTLAHNN